MSYEIKRRIAVAALVLLTAWPLAHYGIVQATGMNPWKWFGWAMYTIPAPRITATVVDVENDRQVPLGSLDPRARQRVQAAYKTFSDARMEFGRLVEPDTFARALFQAFPDVPKLHITVHHVQIRRDTATVEVTEDYPFEYERGDVGL